MLRCIHILRPFAATSQPLLHRLCFSSPTLPASTLAPHKFSSFYFSGLRPPFPVGASPCKVPRHVNNHTYLAAISRDGPGFVRRCLLLRPPALRGFTLRIFRDLPHTFFSAGITLKCLYKTVYSLCTGIYITSVHDRFTASIASASLSPTVPASSLAPRTEKINTPYRYIYSCRCIYISYVRNHFAAAFASTLFRRPRCLLPPLFRERRI